VDAYKLCVGHRRPMPRKACSIGRWDTFLGYMSVMSVITNIALVIFVSPVGDELAHKSIGTKFLIFVAAEHSLLFLKNTVADAVPDKPRWVQMMLDRHEWLVGKVFLEQVQDDDDALQEQAEALVLEIKENDAISDDGSPAGVTGVGANSVANPVVGGKDSI
jgi:anoctamin-10